MFFTSLSDIVSDGLVAGEYYTIQTETVIATDINDTQVDNKTTIWKTTRKWCKLSEDFEATENMTFTTIPNQTLYPWEKNHT